ncbi:hypothetical protein DFJ43DRAFT_609427 [Lentinula guzmanii]|uniref:Uncharacterized protein n=1 Tax=Lentinula guzmanii TaxID=2804957 RepID=A0AA38JHY2_9AGAR|nr:hypothetical protein DFJ43DRAFT_609427 [Lentinula guzmanii]
MPYLFPYIEANFNVSQNPDRRGSVGLSEGSNLVYEMYINSTEITLLTLGMFQEQLVLPAGALQYEYINASLRQILFWQRRALSCSSDYMTSRLMTPGIYNMRWICSTSDTLSNLFYTVAITGKIRFGLSG